MTTLTAFLDLGIGLGAVLLGMVLEVVGFTAIWTGVGLAALLARGIFLVGLRVRALLLLCPVTGQRCYSDVTSFLRL